jgi:hypothetical protein
MELISIFRRPVHLHRGLVAKKAHLTGREVGPQSNPQCPTRLAVKSPPRQSFWRTQGAVI